jgi:hypothetical protein
MFSKLLSRSSLLRNSKITKNTRSFSASFEGYGSHLFKGAVAAPYLERHGLANNALDNPSWTTNGDADKVSNGHLNG